MSVATRLRRIAGTTLSYLRGWRGATFALVSIVAGLVIGFAADSAGIGLAVALVVAGVVFVVGMMLANQDRRFRRLATGARPEVVEPRVEVAPLRPPDVSVRPPALPGEPRRPMVGVVVTAWNESRFIEMAIRSLKDQTLTSFECVIVNDSSTDDTEQVVLDAIAGDQRFTLVRSEANVGLARARNVGLRMIRADFVTFLDGDDFLFPESLASRLKALEAEADRPWVAGSYSHWVNVAEESTIPAETPKPAARRHRVTWLTSLSDAPFIASAPLVRTDVVRAVGGFPDVNTAEDALFWNRVLREGYVFVPVHEVGVAYRMKAASMFRRTAREHAHLITDAYSSNAQPAGDLSGSAPFAFVEGSDAYVWKITLVRRLITALASSVEADSDQQSVIASDVLSELDPFLLWELPLERVVRQQAARACRYLPDAEFAPERDRVSRAVMELLQPRIDEILAEIGQRQRLMRDSVDASDSARILSVPVRQAASVSILASDRSPIDDRVILMPAAAYHVDETGPIAEALRDRGVDSVVMVSDRRWPSIAHAQAAYDQPVLATVEAGPWLRKARGVVVMNDWGEEYREYVDLANDFGVPTFAKVEGVQDFNDDDVHWDRMAYQRAGVVLAQGDNDVNALASRPTVKVSNQRLERIWLGPTSPVDRPLVVVNLNFTYGVLEDARAMWLETVAQACQLVDVPYVISLHPAERDRFDGRYPVAHAPIRYLLTRASALVSRFSTVPFEAMARGVPFVYHNPHGEKVPTFLDPKGAYDVTDSVETLSEALSRTFDEQQTAKARAEAFFLSQVDVRPGDPAAERAARAIVEVLDV